MQTLRDGDLRHVVEIIPEKLVVNFETAITICLVILQRRVHYVTLGLVNQYMLAMLQLLF
jgi:hypothetical protein